MNQCPICNVMFEAGEIWNNHLIYAHPAKIRQEGKRKTTREIPYRCPLCDGRGKVWISAGSTTTLPVIPCNGCSGTGIVWGNEVVEEDVVPAAEVPIAGEVKS